MELVSKGKFEKAKKIGMQACQKDPSNAELWFLLGAIYGELKDYHAAVSCCDKVTKLRPDMAVGFYNLAVAQRNLGNSRMP